jgi:hypothetical protein
MLFAYFSTSPEQKQSAPPRIVAKVAGWCGDFRPQGAKNAKQRQKSLLFCRRFSTIIDSAVHQGTE